MLPEIKFLSLDCTFWLAEPGFCFLGFELQDLACLVGTLSVGEERGREFKGERA